MVAFANAHPGAAQAKFDYSPHQSANPGDVMAGFSSRRADARTSCSSPTSSRPGVDVVSSGLRQSATSRSRSPASARRPGTSMATPARGRLGRAAAAAPPELDAGAGQVGADDDGDRERLDEHEPERPRERARPRRRPHRPHEGRDAGAHARQRRASAPARSSPGQGKDFTIQATDVSGAASTWTVSAVEDGRRRRTSTSRRAPARCRSAANGSATLQRAPRRRRGRGAAARTRARSCSPTARPAGCSTCPVWLRVLDTTPVADVLLVDDDGSSDVGLPGLLAGLQGHVQRAGRQLPVPRRVERRASRRSSTCYRYKAVRDLHGEQRQLRHERLLAGRPEPPVRVAGQRRQALDDRPELRRGERQQQRASPRRASAGRGSTTATSA